MSKIKKDVALRILAPHLQSIRDCIADGFWSYLAKHAGTESFEIRTRCSIVRDYIVVAVRERFERVSGASIFERDGLFLLDIEGKLLIRFKKLNDKLKTSNYQTQQQIDFGYQLEIPGIPGPAVYLTAGYIPSEFWTSQEKIIICSSYDNHVEWAHEIQPKPITVQKIKHPTTLPVSASKKKLVSPKENLKPSVHKKSNRDKNL